MINKNRLNRILTALKNMGVSQMLITDPMSIYYLTDIYMVPMERFYALLLRADGHHAFFLNRLFQVPENVGIEKIWYSDTDSIADIVAPCLDKNSVLGVDKDIRARFLLPLMEANAAAGFVNASSAVDYTRGIKDAEEQSRMRISSAINDAAMAKFKELIHEGVTELEVADQMLSIYLDLGADGYSFPPLVAFGANAADPHHSPDETVLKEGDCVLFDVGCIKEGYCSDMTRTFFYKSASAHCREVYHTVLQANMAAIAAIRPGVSLSSLDQTARSLIANAGYGPYFTHRLGHFIGLGEHEFGDISATNTWEAVPGMIFSIEPGIYLEGDTGVRVEDLVLVSEAGVEVLNHYSKELEIID